MAPVDVAELGVDRQDDTIRVDLRHPDETRIGKVAPVPLDDGLHGRVDRPGMVAVAAIQECDEGPRVDDDGLQRP
jgi:hypothetical protein